MPQVRKKQVSDEKRMLELSMKQDSIEERLLAHSHSVTSPVTIGS